MDEQTIEVYNRSHSRFVLEWMPRTPVKIRELVLKYFNPGSKVLDIGSGSGRDTNWLLQRGFNAEGVDASHGLLKEARSRYPAAVFRFDALPHLSMTETSAYDHALCSAVLMHVPASQVTFAMEHTLRVIRPGGYLICSVRSSRQTEDREEDGRLFTHLTLDDLARCVAGVHAQVLESIEETVEGTQRTWRTIVCRKLS
jgi:2-polyprenyl-3-methyl-5-hydroxy-6-metoxy-1,4-benzoquinol methylase